MPEVDKAMTMIDVGHVTGDCPRLPYRRATIERAGQVACAKINLRPTHTGYTLVTKTGHSLPNHGASHVHIFRGYTPSHIQALVAKGRKGYHAARSAAEQAHTVSRHAWYEAYT